MDKRIVLHRIEVDHVRASHRIPARRERGKISGDILSGAVVLAVAGGGPETRLTGSRAEIRVRDVDRLIGGLHLRFRASDSDEVVAVAPLAADKEARRLWQERRVPGSRVVSFGELRYDVERNTGAGTALDVAQGCRACRAARSPGGPRDEPAAGLGSSDSFLSTHAADGPAWCSPSSR